MDDVRAASSSNALVILGRLGATLVLSQLAMAASAACLVFACSRVLGRPVSPWWYGAAFLASWCVYLRDSAASCNAEDAISQPRRAAIFRDSRFWSWWLPAASALGAAGCALAADPRSATIGLLAAMSLLAALHARRSQNSLHDAPVGPASFSVKRFAAIKSVVVSIAWSGSAVGLCLLESPAPLDRPVLVASVWFAGLVTPVLFADSLLLDLRDRAADRTFGLYTIAVRVGPRGVHALVALMLALAAITTFLGTADAIRPELWQRCAIATTLGLAVPWFGWQSIRRDEVATAFTILAWRLLAALAVL